MYIMTRTARPASTRKARRAAMADMLAAMLRDERARWTDGLAPIDCVSMRNVADMLRTLADTRGLKVDGFTRAGLRAEASDWLGRAVADTPAAMLAAADALCAKADGAECEHPGGRNA